MTNTDIKKITDKYFDDLTSENFNLKGNILYHIPIVDFILGFCLETSKNDNDSLYVWSFVQPLYVPNDSINLSFGKRLKNKLWKLKGNEVLESEINELTSLMNVEISEFFSKTNSPDKFYTFFEKECKNLRMIEALVCSAIFSHNDDAELLLNNFISSLRNENLSIKWIRNILDQMEYLKSILNDNERLVDLYNKNIEHTKISLGIN